MCKDTKNVKGNILFFGFGEMYDESVCFGMRTKKTPKFPKAI